MLRGMTTIRFHTEDLPAATRWYTELLGTEPYFTSPFYVEFRIGDYQHELGIANEPGATPAGVITYWHVDDIDSAFQRLLDLGATEHQAPVQYGEGFVAGSVVDPFGNILGVMYNKHYREIVDRNPDLDLPAIEPVTIPAS